MRRYLLQGNLYISSHSCKLNEFNSRGETPLIIAAKRNLQYPFLIAEAWNGVNEDLLKSSLHRSFEKEKFDFKTSDKTTGKSLLHYFAGTPYLGLAHLIMNQTLTVSMSLDNNLNIPIDYKSQGYLISRKLMNKYFRQAFLLHANKEISQEHQDFDIIESCCATKSFYSYEKILEMNSTDQENHNLPHDDKSVLINEEIPNFENQFRLFILFRDFPTTKASATIYIARFRMLRGKLIQSISQSTYDNKEKIFRALCSSHRVRDLANLHRRAYFFTLQLKYYIISIHKQSKSAHIHHLFELIEQELASNIIPLIDVLKAQRDHYSFRMINILLDDLFKGFSIGYDKKYAKLARDSILESKVTFINRKGILYYNTKLLSMTKCTISIRI